MLDNAGFHTREGNSSDPNTSPDEVSDKNSEYHPGSKEVPKRYNASGRDPYLAIGSGQIEDERPRVSSRLRKFQTNPANELYANSSTISKNISARPRSGGESDQIYQSNDEGITPIPTPKNNKVTSRSKIIEDLSDNGASPYSGVRTLPAALNRASTSGNYRSPPKTCTTLSSLMQHFLESITDPSQGYGEFFGILNFAEVGPKREAVAFDNSGNSWVYLSADSVKYAVYGKVTVERSYLQKEPSDPTRISLVIVQCNHDQMKPQQGKLPELQLDKDLLRSPAFRAKKSSWDTCQTSYSLFGKRNPEVGYATMKQLIDITEKAAATKNGGPGEHYGQNSGNFNQIGGNIQKGSPPFRQKKKLDKYGAHNFVNIDTTFGTTFN